MNEEFLHSKPLPTCTLVFWKKAVSVLFDLSSTQIEPSRAAENLSFCKNFPQEFSRVSDTLSFCFNLDIYVESYMWSSPLWSMSGSVLCLLIWQFSAIAEVGQLRLNCSLDNLHTYTKWFSGYMEEQMHLSVFQKLLLRLKYTHTSPTCRHAQLRCHT